MQSTASVEKTKKKKRRFRRASQSIGRSEVETPRRGPIEWRSGKIDSLAEHSTEKTKMQEVRRASQSIGWGELQTPRRRGLSEWRSGNIDSLAEHSTEKKKKMQEVRRASQGIGWSEVETPRGGPSEWQSGKIDSLAEHSTEKQKKKRSRRASKSVGRSDVETPRGGPGEWQSGSIVRIEEHYAFIRMPDHQINQGSNVHVSKRILEGLQDHAEFKVGASVRFIMRQGTKGPYAETVRLAVSSEKVLTRDLPPEEIDAFKKALSDDDTLPNVLKSALGNKGAKLEARDDGRIVLLQPEKVKDMRGLERIARKVKISGFCRWLCGECGWSFACPKDKTYDFVDYLKKLQELYKTDLRSFISAKNEQARTFFYQSLGETAEVWLLGTARNIRSYIERVRPFLEVILYYEYDCKKEWQDPLTWLHGIDADERKKRWAKIARQAQTLMRTSNTGPDVPVQWANHTPRNHHRFSLITVAVLTELVIGLGNIVQYMCIAEPRADLTTLVDLNNLLSEKHVAKKERKKRTTIASGNDLNLDDLASDLNDKLNV